MTVLDKERDAIMGICLAIAKEAEERIGFPVNIRYEAYAKVARMAAAEIEKRKGIVYGEDGEEIDLAAVDAGLKACQEEVMELKKLLAGLRVERDRLKSCVMAHEENTAHIVRAHNTAIDRNKEKDVRIGALEETHQAMLSRIRNDGDAMEAERKAIREHERALCVAAVKELWREFEGTQHAWAAKRAVDALERRE